MIQQRRTAYKVWIYDLYNSEYVEQLGEFESNYIQIKNKQVSRVSIVATVVNKYANEANTYAAITLDDSSDTIRVKAWNEDIQILKDLKKGQIIHIIGRIRKQQDELYIVPEIIKIVDDPNIELLRKAELIKEYGVKQDLRIEPRQIAQEITEIQPQSPTESARQELLNIVERLDCDEGVSITIIVNEASHSEDEVEKALKELIKDGEIFEPKPGKVKIIK